MREKIIIAPGVNSNELLNSLAMHGQNTINMRICNSGELARMAYMRSGIHITEDFMDSAEEEAVIAKAVEGEKYFGNATYSDIQEITRAVRRMRFLVADDNEEKALEDTLNKGIFQDKNKALFSVYKKYVEILASEKAIDAVALVRKAITECGNISADFYILEEYPLSPLEKKLVEKLSGGKYKSISICELYGTTGETTKISGYKNCYGAPNEVESVLEHIYKEKKADQCTVAVTDPATYGQLFYDYALLYDLPITFGTGIPIINSNPARLLSLYYAWTTSGFFGADAVNAMLSNGAFDKNKLYDQFPERDEDFRWSVFYEVLGGIRFTTDEQTNKQRLQEFKKAVEEELANLGESEGKNYKSVYQRYLCIPCLEVMAKELALPTEAFISKYSYIRKGADTNRDRLVMNLDIAAKSSIYEDLKVIRESGIVQDTDSIILNILKSNVCIQRSEPGKIHVTSIDGAITCIRDNLFIMGLSASKYPGSPKENYLLLDEDLKLFGNGAEYLTSDAKILRKREQLLKLAKLATSLGADIYASYAGLNVSELKKDNASSMIFELFREANGKTATAKDLDNSIEKVDYFKPSISLTRLIGDAYNQGKVIKNDMTDSIDEDNMGWNLDKEYSPTALDSFFGCPRKFWLSYILGIPEPEEKDPFEIISASASGTMAHELMEETGGTDIGEDDFLKMSGEYFDRYIKENPPLIGENVEAAKEQFMEMMETAYEMDPHREIALKEEDIHFAHESGVKLRGFPDRVEKLDDGTYLIVDFKTARSVSHVEDDIDTCLQIVIYAYLMEQKGYKVSGGEYRYLRLGDTVRCKYDDEMKNKLSEKLNTFKEAMLSGEFPIPVIDKENNPCKYCKYGSICGKQKEEGVEI
ncbi:PD-(D/E)XK nuclease family protein [Butyrivibrio sp. VCD2006]|uniref:PD-(D/E)XK nuclease family protein n=1 Tax=Butyrivibrio sp. VCD2006 TaxID=1280664 RepID=UPI00040248DC|nr:PD-(D/E)XK nuclease family protein [Butyrivibrio sp. VCD2006]